MTNMQKAQVVFWVHFAVALASHIFVILMIGGVLKLLLAASLIGFWEKGLMLGLTFYTAMYAVNHVTEKDGFCVLTDLENYYRLKEAGRLGATGNIKVGPFTPRFYFQCAEIGRAITSIFKRRKK